MNTSFEQSPGDIDYRLSVEDEQLLATQIQEGEQATRLLSSRDSNLEDSHRLELEAQSAQGRVAIEKLVGSNIRLISHIVKRFSDVGILDREDLFQEGFFGLLRAAERYRPEKGARFSTFAYISIDRRVRRAIYESSENGYRLPVHIGVERKNYYGNEAALIAELGRMPTSEEVMLAAGTNSDRIRAIRKIGTVIPLESGRGYGTTRESTDMDGVPRLKSDPIDLLASEGPSVEEQVLEHLKGNEIYSILENTYMTDPERLVLEMLSGFDSSDGSIVALNDIANLMGLSRERVRQIAVKAMKKVRDSFRGHGGIFGNIIPSDEDLDYMANPTAFDSQAEERRRLGSVDYEELSEQEKKNLNQLLAAHHHIADLRKEVEGLLNVQNHGEHVDKSDIKDNFLDLLDTYGQIKVCRALDSLSSGDQVFHKPKEERVTEHNYYDWFVEKQVKERSDHVFKLETLLVSLVLALERNDAAELMSKAREYLTEQPDRESSDDDLS